MTSRASLAALAGLVMCAAGCADPDPGVPTHHDAAIRADGGTGADTGPVQHDAMVSCASGQHACGAGCITDQPNDPMHGCLFGCGAPCPMPTMGTASCTSAGACDFTCPSPFHRVGDTCACTPRDCASMSYVCGSPDDGCGTPLNCGTCSGSATCVLGRCGCTPDAHEPNDSNAVATMGAALTDMPDTNVTLTDYTIDHMGDVDWIQFHVTDAVDGGDPHITVRLYNVPSGSDYDLGVWYVCNNHSDASVCTVGTQNNMIGRGCVSSHPGITEENVDLPTDCGSTLLIPNNADGILFVRVTAPTFGGTCSPYALDVRVR